MYKAGDLGEIENAICSDDKILQDVLVVRKDDSNIQLTCAFHTEKSAIDVVNIKKIISDRRRGIFRHTYSCGIS